MRTGFAVGDIVHVRHFQRDRPSAVYSGRAVRHDADGVLVWMGEGSQFWFPYMPDGREERETTLEEWAASEPVWQLWEIEDSLLSWHPTGVNYSVRFEFDAGEFTGWYANLEAAGVPWQDNGFNAIDTSDWDLDVVVAPDRSWRLKDTDVLERRSKTPELYWVDDVEAVHQAGRDVVALVEAGCFPFDGTWLDFVPDAAWTPVVGDALPAGWDQPRRRRPGTARTADGG
jgi:hypothetical protein